MRENRRKGMKFWMERLIINSEKELGFRTQFQAGLGQFPSTEWAPFLGCVCPCCGAPQMVQTEEGQVKKKMWWFWCQQPNVFAHWYKWNLRVLDEIEKNSRAVLLCQKKEDTVDSCALRTVYPNPGGFDEEFYSTSFKGRVADKWACVQGLHSANLVSVNLEEKNVKKKVKVTQSCRLFVTPWTI